MCFSRGSLFRLAVVDMVTIYSTLTSISKAITSLFLNSRVYASWLVSAPSPGPRQLYRGFAFALNILFGWPSAVFAVHRCSCHEWIQARHDDYVYFVLWHGSSFPFKLAWNRHSQQHLISGERQPVYMSRFLDSLVRRSSFATQSV